MKKRQRSPIDACKGNSQAGQALVEYAVVITLFVVLLFGIIDFGRVLYTYNYLSDATRDATRWASVNGATCNSDTSCNGNNGMHSGPLTSGNAATSVVSYLTSHAPPGIDTSKITTSSVTVNFLNLDGTTCSGNLSTPGCLVKVRITYPYNFVSPIIYNRTLTLANTSQMVIVH